MVSVKRGGTVFQMFQEQMMRNCMFVFVGYFCSFKILLYKGPNGKHATAETGKLSTWASCKMQLLCRPEMN
ncbi:hypothetical protein RJT34_14349 [Clitoria ternatea]|uniref:Uncharacterized protein n=1 Tax=Clitoria ternatea TaxID=43366 RepID=A0AAN9JT54_CLITE